MKIIKYLFNVKNKVKNIDAIEKKLNNISKISLLLFLYKFINQTINKVKTINKDIKSILFL